MLNVQIDVTPLRGQLSGIGYYVYNLVQALEKFQATEQFRLSLYFHPSLKNWLKRDFTPSSLIQDYPSVQVIPLPVTVTNLLMKFPNPFLGNLENNLLYPDILQGTDHFVYPCRHSFKIMTIHDLTFMKYPEYVTARVKTYTSRIQQGLKWTDLIITFAESTRQDIVQYLGFPREKIKITPQASRYSSSYLESFNIEALKQQVSYDFNRPYILFVSTLEPRKNIQTLIEAFNTLKQQHKIEHQLVLIGKKGWKYDKILQAISHSPYQKEIHQLDYLSEALVALFYQRASVFVYPSYYEGFGLPILEAMTLGAPVITSQISSLPEVAGEAALFINPYHPLELAEAILQVIQDSTLRQQLIQKGQERAKQFSWEKTAQKTLEIYLSLGNYQK